MCFCMHFYTNRIFICSISHTISLFFQKNLRMSEKSSTFAPIFEKNTEYRVQNTDYIWQIFRS